MIDQKINQSVPTKNIEAFGALLEVDQQARQIKTRQSYVKAYVISLLFPPLGVYYFFKYLFFADGSTADIKAGVLSLALSVISIVVSIWSFAALFGQLVPGSSSQSIDLLKKTATPENIKELIKLYQ
jgi:hypothetical protein